MCPLPSPSTCEINSIKQKEKEEKKGHAIYT
jgi:hypothetical protein